MILVILVVAMEMVILQKKKRANGLVGCPLALKFLGDPLGARTQDPNIKSVVLYLLS